MFERDKPMEFFPRSWTFCGDPWRHRKRAMSEAQCGAGPRHVGLFCSGSVMVNGLVVGNHGLIVFFHDN